MTRLEAGFPNDMPRRELVTSPEFTALKERALEALELLTAHPPAPESRHEPDGRGRRLARAYGPSLLLVAAGLALWELLVRVLDVPDFIWPAPSLIGATLRDEAGLLADHTGRHPQRGRARLPDRAGRRNRHRDRPAPVE